jgi:hypothetical protein
MKYKLTSLLFIDKRKMDDYPRDIEEIILEYYNPYKEKHNEMLKEITSPYSLGECWDMKVSIENYIGKWKKTECLVKRHRIVFSKPFGVIGTCLDCRGYLECFNYCD